MSSLVKRFESLCPEVNPTPEIDNVPKCFHENAKKKMKKSLNLRTCT